MRGGDERVAAARDVGAGRGHRDVLLPQVHPRLGLDLEVAQRVPLVLGEGADPLLDGLDVSDGLGGDSVDRVLNLLGAEPKLLGAPPVELLRVATDGGVAALTDIGNDLCDGVTNGRVTGLLLGARAGGLDVGGHGGSPWVGSACSRWSQVERYRRAADRPVSAVVHWRTRRFSCSTSAAEP